jgi:hypothetical protein
MDQSQRINRTPQRRHPERGAALIPLVFLFAALLITLGIIYLGSCSNVFKLSLFRVKRTKALYLAESGVEKALMDLRTGRLSVPGELSFKLSEGSVRVKLEKMENKKGELILLSRGSTDGKGKDRIHFQMKVVCRYVPGEPGKPARIQVLSREY